MNYPSDIHKRSDLNYIISYVSKKLFEIKDNQNIKSNRIKSSEELYCFIVLNSPELKQSHLEKIVLAYNKDFIQLGLFEKESDKIREYCVLILIFIYNKVKKYAKNVFPFIFSAFVYKFDCDDLEGIGHLPEDIRPTPSTKPHRVSKITENSEEIRMKYVILLKTLVVLNEEIDIDEYDLFINDIVNITRCLIMDTCNDVILSATILTKELALRFKTKLYHFNSLIARSLFLPLIKQQSKLRIAALEAIDALLLCSPFKKNYEILEGLIGFRDPNIVPIKDFYEPNTKLNYLAMLISDSNSLVRKKFIDIISNWLINNEDRFDFESKLVPYILSGLFDDNEEIAEFSFNRLEDIGKKQEEDNEKTMREEIQYGVDYKWTKYYYEEGKSNKDELYLPFPIKNRPRRGARFLIKKYLRRYIHNLCKEFDSIEYSIKLKASKLLLYSIAYSEETIYEFLNDILLCLFKELSKNIYSIHKNDDLNTNNSKSIIEYKEANELKSIIQNTCFLIGRYTDYEAISKIVYPTLRGDMFGVYSGIEKGALHCFSYIIKGHMHNNNIANLGVYGENIEDMLYNLFPNNNIEYDKDSEEKQLNSNNSRFINEKESKNTIKYCYQTSLCLEYLELLSTLSNQLEFNNYKDNHINYKKTFFNLSMLCISDVNIEMLHNNINVIKLIKSYIKDISSKLNDNYNDFYDLKIKILLNDIKHKLEKDSNSIFLNNNYFKLVFFIIKSDLFNSIYHISLFVDIMNIFNILFKDCNYLVHVETLNLYNYFLTKANEKSIIIDENNTHNQVILFFELYFVIAKKVLLNYQEETIIKSENDNKIKYVDLLKPDQELKKQQKKSIKYYKSQLKLNLLKIIKNNTKNLFNNNNLFIFKNNNNNTSCEINSLFYYIIEFLNVIDDELIETLFDDNNEIKELFSEIFLNHSVKLMVDINKQISKDNKIMKKISKYTKHNSNDKSIINNNNNNKLIIIDNNILDYNSVNVCCLIKLIEKYYNYIIEEDSIEIKKNGIKTLNSYLNLFEISELNKPLKGLFSEYSNNTVDNHLLMRALSYIKDEDEYLNKYFDNFKNIFSQAIKAYIEDNKLCNELNTFFSLAIEKFPVFVISQFNEYKEKGRFNRIEVLQKLLKDNL